MPVNPFYALPASPPSFFAMILRTDTSSTTIKPVYCRDAIPDVACLPPDAKSGGKYGWFPQPGPQTEFLKHEDDIIVFGGSVAGGKSVALLLDFLKYKDDPFFRGVIFRRINNQIMQPGGLWEWANTIYGYYGAKPNKNLMRFIFPSGATVDFKNLQYEDSKHAYQGGQFSRVGFDEGTHFTSGQFWYIQSRLRTMAGSPTTVRVTCNPDPDSWVAELIAWWIGEDGFPIQSRIHDNRWIFRHNDVMHVFASYDEAKYTLKDTYKGSLDAKLLPLAEPLSVRFIPSSLTDNPLLLANNPKYVANLISQGTVDMERLLKGNWKITAEDGIFRRSWFHEKDIDPRMADRAKWKRLVRAWDLASTPKKPDNDPDWTVGALLAIDDLNRVYVVDVIRGQWSSGDVQSQIESACRADRQAYGSRYSAVIEQESGKGWVETIIRALAGHPVSAAKVSQHGDKVSRAKPLATYAQAGNVFLLRGDWNKPFMSEVGRFPYAENDDIVDACSLGFAQLTSSSITSPDSILAAWGSRA